MYDLQVRDLVTKSKVLVAMSGGVDSSVAAALLLQQGYKIEGATIEMWPKDDPVYTGKSTPCLRSAVLDAQQVAKTLGITHHVIDFSQEFAENVVNNFINEYFKGRTPNPCIVCNRKIKFGAFFQAARDLGADMVATGHYAQVVFDEDSGRYLLYRGKDKTKDQTYVLYSLTQGQLEEAIFPLGRFSKQEIRNLAEEFKLPVADKKESQEICFIPDNDYRRFLKAAGAHEVIPGPFLDMEGKEIGKHRGIPFYTIGQRKGLGLALGYPAYVISIDAKNNAVVVGPKDALFSREVLVKNNNFISFDRLEEPVQVSVKIRYNSTPAEAVIAPKEDMVVVTFKEPQKAVTPGQSAVYYQGDMVVGGGIIESSQI